MRKPFNPPTDEGPEALLLWYYQRNGYKRIANEDRRLVLGKKYKKGWEVRLVADDETQLAQIRALLEIVSFKVRKPFQKHKQLVQPVYGKRAVEWFTLPPVDDEAGEP